MQPTEPTSPSPSELTSSPVPTAPNDPAKVGMSFFDALKTVLDDKKITKLEWGNDQIYGHLKENVIVSLHKPDGKDYDWIISDGDLHGTDWIVL